MFYKARQKERKRKERNKVKIPSVLLSALLLLLSLSYGLRPSSLIMGVHPGCPVCSIVAASLVAVETDVGETIFAAKKIISHLCVVSSLWELLRSFLRTIFPTSVFTSFSSPDLRCWFRVLLHLMRSAARSSQDSVLMLSALHVSLVDILVAQLSATFGSPS